MPLLTASISPTSTSLKFSRTLRAMLIDVTFESFENRELNRLVESFGKRLAER